MNLFKLLPEIISFVKLHPVTNYQNCSMIQIPGNVFQWGAGNPAITFRIWLLLKMNWIEITFWENASVNLTSTWKRRWFTMKEVVGVLLYLLR